MVYGNDREFLWYDDNMGNGDVALMEMLQSIKKPVPVDLIVFINFIKFYLILNPFMHC